jgi:hypothetical protein
VTLGSTVGVKRAAGTSAALSAVLGRTDESPGQMLSAWASGMCALGGTRTPNLLIRSKIRFVQIQPSLSIRPVGMPRGN